MRILHFYLPVFNGEDYISELIKSVLRQDCSNWTLTVLDNASSDATSNVVNAFSDPRISYCHFAEHVSIEKSFSRVLESLPTNLDSYISILGHDDLLLPAFTREILALAQENPNASILHAHFNLINEQGELLRPCKPMPLQEGYEEFISARSWGLRDSYGVGYVFKAANFLAIGGYPLFPSLLFADDFLVAKLTSLGFKACSSQTLFSYRVNRKSESGQFSAKKFLNNIRALELYFEKIKIELPHYFDKVNNSRSFAFQIHRLESLMNTSFSRPLVSIEDRALIKRLAKTKESLYQSKYYDQFWGGNFLISKLYPLALRIYVGVSLLRARLK